MSNYNNNILEKISKNLKSCVELLNQEGAGEMNTAPIDTEVMRKELVSSSEADSSTSEEKVAVESSKSNSVLQKINDLLEKLTPISDEVSDKTGEYHTTKSQMKAKNLNTSEEVEAAAKTKEEELSGLQKKSIELDEKIREVEKDLEQAREKNEQLTSLSQNFRNKISTEMTQMEGILQSVEREAGPEGENLKLDKISDDLEGLLNLIGGAMKKVTDVDAFKENITEFLNRKNQIMDKLTVLKSKIPLLLEKFNEVITSKDAMDRLNNTSEQISSLNSDLTDLNQQLAKTEGELKDTLAENDRLDSDSRESNKTATTIMRDINTRMEKMNDLVNSSDINNIEDKVNKLTETVNTIEAEMDADAPTDAPTDAPATATAPATAPTPTVTPVNTDVSLPDTDDIPENDDDIDEGETKASSEAARLERERRAKIRARRRGENSFKYQYKFVNA